MVTPKKLKPVWSGELPITEKPAPIVFHEDSRGPWVALLSCLVLILLVFGVLTELRLSKLEKKDSDASTQKALFSERVALIDNLSMGMASLHPNEFPLYVYACNNAVVGVFYYRGEGVSIENNTGCKLQGVDFQDSPASIILTPRAR